MAKRKKRDYSRQNVPIVRSDSLKTRKSIHVWVGNNQYVQLRSKLFLVELSIQQVVNEFLDLLLSGDRRAESIMRGMIEKRRKCKLKQIKLDSVIEKKKIDMTEEDRETIYQLFEEDFEND